MPLGNHFCFYNYTLKYPLKQLHLPLAAAVAAANDCKDQIVFAVEKISMRLTKICTHLGPRENEFWAK